jgi:penicillin-binding protein 1A
MSPYLPSALGASKVPLIEMVSAYSAFPNKGVRVEPHLIRKVLDRDGNILEQWENTTYKVTSEYAALTMVEMMRGVVQAGGTAGNASAAGHPLAGKTGTVNDHTDVWFIGYTPSYVTGVWMGNPLRKESLGRGMTGGGGALPYFNAFMNGFMKDKPRETFPEAPPMPADVKALFEQRRREEEEKREEEALATATTTNRVNTGAVRKPRSSSESESSGTLDSDTPPVLERDTVPASRDNADSPPSQPKPDVPVTKPEPPVRKPEPPATKPDSSSGNDPRQRVVEAPKKKGKKGDDEP